MLPAGKMLWEMECDVWDVTMFSIVTGCVNSITGSVHIGPNVMEVLVVWWNLLPSTWFKRRRSKARVLKGTESVAAGAPDLLGILVKLQLALPMSSLDKAQEGEYHLNNEHQL